MRSCNPQKNYYNVSLIKTRCRASRRGEGFSPVGVRLPNPYENVHLCLEFAIYQTHVIIGSAKAAPAGRKVYRNAGEQPSYTKLTEFVLFYFF